jgi:hypothetical protein
VCQIDEPLPDYGGGKLAARTTDPVSQGTCIIYRDMRVALKHLITVKAGNTSRSLLYIIVQVQGRRAQEVRV